MSGVLGTPCHGQERTVPLGADGGLLVPGEDAPHQGTPANHRRGTAAISHRA